jgi:DMSO reductase anchor subunit
MYPAFSVIFFTVASGAGYGLLILLGISAAVGVLPRNGVLAATSTGLALFLVTAGLLSSMAHLGHPERAWRAFSQWRSSWLSREGVAAVLTYFPALGFAAGWMVEGDAGGWVSIAGLVAAAGAMLTVTCTGMIYASLKPVTPWYGPYTLPVYLALALMTGAVVFNAISHVVGISGFISASIAGIAIIVAWLSKWLAWRAGDQPSAIWSLNHAIGLAGGGVRSVEWPHTEENYVLKQMGYRVARKHAARLRLITHLLAFCLPLALTLISLITDGAPATSAAILATLIQAPGVLIERWLFFAEARHTATLYYGR